MPILQEEMEGVTIDVIDRLCTTHIHLTASGVDFFQGGWYANEQTKK
jgi:hypothetical protein